MFTTFQIIHRKKPNLFGEAPPNWVVFSTCLRSLALSFSEAPFPGLLASDEVYHGDQAYRFLLEVTCGLQSPIVGETEVFGQFRNFAENWQAHPSMIQSVFADTKLVRQTHLSHLGSQSYGSWVRKQIRPDMHLHLVGSGQLSAEILTWLRKHAGGITIYTRDVESAKARLRKDLSDISMEFKLVEKLSDVKEGAVVIATSIRSDELPFITARVVIDLREESDTDLIRLDARKYIVLKDVFSEIERDRGQAQQKIEQAHSLLNTLVRKRFDTQTVRPFGWDDLCA